MGEISIDPKFNIHETYKKVRILNPYRNSGAPSGTNDADAANYLAAVGIINDATVYYAGTPQEITGAAIYTAMNTFVGALKSEGVYAKLKAVYPLIGGNAGNHKWNLINPQDTNAAHRMTWFGAGTHSNTGFKGDGATSYGDTMFVPIDNGVLGSESFGVYSRSLGAGTFFDFGVDFNFDSFMILHLNGNFYTRSQNTNYGLIQTSSANGLGFFGISRTSTSIYYNQINGNSTLINSTATGLPSLSYRIARINAVNNYSTREYAYIFIGEGLTETQMTAHYNAVQQLQTDLKRAV